MSGVSLLTGTKLLLALVAHLHCRQILTGRHLNFCIFVSVMITATLKETQQSSPRPVKCYELSNKLCIRAEEVPLLLLHQPWWPAAVSRERCSQAPRTAAPRTLERLFRLLVISSTDVGKHQRPTRTCCWAKHEFNCSVSPHFRAALWEIRCKKLQSSCVVIKNTDMLEV